MYVKTPYSDLEGEKESMMRRSLTLLVAVAALIGLMALPASATVERFVWGPNTEVVSGIDPCTGGAYEATIVWTMFIQQDDDFFDGRVESTGTTDTGYTMIVGNGQLHGDERGFQAVVKEIWYNPDTGAAYTYNSVFRETDIIVDEESLECLIAP